MADRPDFQGSTYVDAGTVTVTGTVDVGTITGTVTVAGTVAVSAITGTVTVTGSVDVGTISGTVTVTGTVDVGSIIGTVTVSGTVDVGTISGSVSISGPVTIENVSGGILASAGDLRYSGSATSSGGTVATHTVTATSKERAVLVAIPSDASGVWSVTVTGATTGIVTFDGYVRPGTVVTAYINPSSDTDWTVSVANYGSSNLTVRVFVDTALPVVSVPDDVRIGEHWRQTLAEATNATSVTLSGTHILELAAGAGTSDPRLRVRRFRVYLRAYPSSAGTLVLKWGRLNSAGSGGGAIGAAAPYDSGGVTPAYTATANPSTPGGEGVIFGYCPILLPASGSYPHPLWEWEETPTSVGPILGTGDNGIFWAVHAGLSGASVNLNVEFGPEYQ